mgnify:CR=1 FL=1
MNGETILIVEDEQPIAHVLTTILSANGYHTLQASTGTLARSIINSHCPRLILLDLGLPDMDGLELLRWLREWSGVPVLIVSAREEENQKVEALDLGADDYIVKPFDAKEVIARINAVTRRVSANTAEPEAKEVHYDKLSVNMDSYELKVNGKNVDTPPKELELLQIRTEFTHATSSSMRYGALSTTAIHARSTFTSSACAKSLREFPINGLSRPSGA